MEIAAKRGSEGMKEPCQRLCIDDLCRGNPDDTLCGGSYCSSCHDPKCHDSDLCDDCRESSYEDYDDSYEGLQ